MEKTRSNIFADDEPLDLSDLKKLHTALPALPAAQIRAVAEASQFTSREPKRQQNRYRTGRNMPKVIQFDHTTLNRFMSLYDTLGGRKPVTYCEVIEYLLDLHDAKQGLNEKR